METTILYPLTCWLTFGAFPRGLGYFRQSCHEHSCEVCVCGRLAFLLIKYLRIMDSIFLKFLFGTSSIKIWVGHAPEFLAQYHPYPCKALSLFHLFTYLWICLFFPFFSTPHIPSLRVLRRVWSRSHITSWPRQENHPTRDVHADKKESVNQFWQIHTAMGNILVICQETHTASQSVTWNAAEQGV